MTRKMTKSIISSQKSDGLKAEIPVISPGMLLDVPAGARVFARNAPLSNLGFEVFNDLERDFFFTYFLTHVDLRKDVPQDREINQRLLNFVLSDARINMQRLMTAGLMYSSAAAAVTLFNEMMDEPRAQQALQNEAEAENLEDQADELEKEAEEKDPTDPQDGDEGDPQDGDEGDPQDGDEGDPQDGESDSESDSEDQSGSDSDETGSGTGDEESDEQGDDGSDDSEDENSESEGDEPGGEDSDGRNDSDEYDDEESELGDEPGRDPQELRDLAKALREQAAQLREEATNALDDMEGDAFAGMVRSQMAEAAADAAEEVSAFLASWGIEQGAGIELDIQQVLELIQMMGNPQLMALTTLMGKVYEIAFSVLKGRNPTMIMVDEGGLTQEIEDIEGDELALLSHFAPSAIRQDAFERFDKRGMRGVVRDSQAQREGDFIFSVDGSGSMKSLLGEPRDGISFSLVAMALSLGLAKAAKKNGQGFTGFTFGSGGDISECVTEKSDIGELFHWATHTFGGGTDFDMALNHKLDLFEALSDERKAQADLLMITDGDASVSWSTVERVKAFKEQYGLRLFVLMIGQSGMQGLPEIADRILNFNSLEGIAETLAKLMWDNK